MPWEAAIAIPARNEEKRLLRCLTALEGAIDKAGRTLGIVLVVNNSDDATYALAEAWLSHTRLPHVVVNVDFAQAWACVGSARRLSLDLAAEMVEREGLLFTSDADSVVDPNWVLDGFSEIRERADLVCGTILRAEDEPDILEADIARRSAPERDYLALSVELAARFDPRPHDPFPAHWNAGGADLAFTKALYCGVGGLPLLACGEDRAFVARAERLDYRVVYSPNLIVRTSCRLNGRAAGGLSDSLRSWMGDRDPLCDDRLADAEASGRRFWLRGCLRRLGTRPADDSLVQGLAVGPEMARRRRRETFGAYWNRLEASCFPGPRARLRVSDLVRELPGLSTMIARLRAGDRPGDDIRDAFAWIAHCTQGDA